MKNISLLLLFLLLSGAVGQELIGNGDFENGTDSWIQEQSSSGGTYSITCDTSYQPDSDYEVRIYKTMAAYARLRQTVELPGTNVRFLASVKAAVSTGTKNRMAYAGVVLEYRNSSNTLLGKTMVIKKIGSGAPQSGPTQHVIDVTSDDWEDHGFILADELENLTGVNPDSIARVNLYVQAYGNGST